MKIADSTFKKALVLGLMSGMRTTAGLLFVRSLVRNSTSTSPLVHFLQKKPVLAGIAAMGVSELVADKLPDTPDRIVKSGPAFRAGAGALCGATVYRAAGEKAMTGAVIGSLAAIASTYVFFYLRKTICEKTSIPDPVVGAAEDALAIASGFILTK